MTMSQVAEAVGVHETTVSRAVSGKYIETPHGVLRQRLLHRRAGFQGQPSA